MKDIKKVLEEDVPYRDDIDSVTILVEQGILRRALQEIRLLRARVVWLEIDDEL